MKTALVTGGNKGIGFAAAKGLAEKGYRVFLGSRDAAKGEKAVEELHRQGLKNVELLVIDVTSAESIQNAAQKLSSAIEKLDVLVNNAGIYIDGNKNPVDVDTKVILDTFNTNTLGPLQVTRAFVPLLEKAKGAQVINVSSGMGQLSEMGSGALAYRISKTALNTVTRVLANELSAKSIFINSICPGWVHTDMGGKEAPRSPEEGADTIVWLAMGGAGVHTGLFLRDRKQINW